MNIYGFLFSISDEATISRKKRKWELYIYSKFQLYRRFIQFSISVKR